MEAVLELMNKLDNKIIFLKNGNENKEFIEMTDETGAMLTGM